MQISLGDPGRPPPLLRTQLALRKAAHQPVQAKVALQPKEVPHEPDEAPRTPRAALCPELEGAAHPENVRVRARLA